LGIVRRQRQSAAVVLLVIEKTGSQVFVLSFNSTDAPLYCKNDLVSSQNALSTEVFIFIWFLASAATKFHIFVRQWARKCYIAQKHFVMTFFQQILNTYNRHNNLIVLHVKI
jgi:hypothetical protein